MGLKQQIYNDLYNFVENYNYNSKENHKMSNFVKTIALCKRYRHFMGFLLCAYEVSASKNIAV